MYETLSAIFLIITFFAVVVGTLATLSALVIAYMIVRGYVVWPFFETRWIIPSIRKGIRDHPDSTIPAHIVRYLNSAEARGLVQLVNS